MEQNETRQAAPAQQETSAQHASKAPGGQEKPQKPKKAKKPRKPWTAKRIIILAAVVLLAVFLVYSCVAAPVIAANAAMNQVSTLAVTQLTPKDITSTISATGTVESADKHYVYPAATGYTVMEVPVEVGDRVEAGDVLCILDDSAIQDQIETNELSLDQNVRAAEQQVKTVRDSYEAAIAAVKDGTNATLINAESQVTNAYNSYLSAVENYRQYQSNLSSASSDLAAARQKVQDIQAAIDSMSTPTPTPTALPSPSQDAGQGEQQVPVATPNPNQGSEGTDQGSGQDSVQNPAQGTPPATPVQSTPGQENAQPTPAAGQGETGLVTGSAPAASGASTSAADYAGMDLTALQTALAAAEQEQAAAQSAYDSLAGQGYSLSLAIDTAYNNYQTALKSLDAAIASVETSLQSSENQLDAAKITAESARDTRDLTLEHLNESLADTVVTAPASGTITAVYATVGGAGSGLLFVIEDTEDLIVNTSVRSYDIATVQEGMAVSIRSDATGDAAFDGVITAIAPASMKNAAGDTDSTNEVFETEVAVTSQDTGLRIGMSVRLNYILDSAEGVLAVPYDAIYTNAAGQSCVLGAQPREDGQYELVEIPVTTGIENDYEIAISGQGIEAGLYILNDPSSHAPGDVVILV